MGSIVEWAICDKERCAPEYRGWFIEQQKGNEARLGDQIPEIDIRQVYPACYQGAGTLDL